MEPLIGEKLCLLYYFNFFFYSRLQVAPARFLEFFGVGRYNHFCNERHGFGVMGVIKKLKLN